MIYMYLYICVSVYLCICISVYLYIYMHVYVCVYLVLIWSEQQQRWYNSIKMCFMGLSTNFRMDPVYTKSRK